jgi:hypothetical protein
MDIEQSNVGNYFCQHLSIWPRFIEFFVYVCLIVFSDSYEHIEQSCYLYIYMYKHIYIYIYSHLLGSIATLGWTIAHKSNDGLIIFIQHCIYEYMYV